MGVQERRQRHKGALRQEILDAARDLFVHEGYRNVSMRRVAERIEYSPTTIYLHFKNKEDLLFCICEQTFAKLVKEFETLGREPGDPVAALQKGMRTYVQFALKHPHDYLATFGTPHEHGTPAQSERYLCEEAKGMQAFGFLRQSVAECVQQGRFRPVDVEIASRALWAGIHGIASLLIVHPRFPWGDEDKVIDLVMDSMIEGLRARP